MGREVRDYTNPNEIHMESGELHDSTNTVPPYPSELESALSQVSRGNQAALGGTCYAIAAAREERAGVSRGEPREDFSSGVNIDPGRDIGPSASHRSPIRGHSTMEQGGAGDAG